MKKVSSSPKTNKAFPSKKEEEEEDEDEKQKAVELGWGNVISIFLGPERILASGCNSLGCLGRLVYIDLFINSLEIQILQVRP